VVMVLPPGGFFVLAGWLLLFAVLKRRKENRARGTAIAEGQRHGV